MDNSCVFLNGFSSPTKTWGEVIYQSFSNNSISIKVVQLATFSSAKIRRVSVANSLAATWF